MTNKILTFVKNVKIKNCYSVEGKQGYVLV